MKRRNRRGGTDDRTCRRLPTSVLLARHSTVSRSRIAASPPGSSPGMQCLPGSGNAVRPE